jgi:hypothetical protein
MHENASNPHGVRCRVGFFDGPGVFPRRRRDLGGEIVLFFGWMGVYIILTFEYFI